MSVRWAEGLKTIGWFAVRQPGLTGLLIQPNGFLFYLAIFYQALLQMIKLSVSKGVERHGVLDEALPWCVGM